MCHSETFTDEQFKVFKETAYRYTKRKVLFDFVLSIFMLIFLIVASCIVCKNISTSDGKAIFFVASLVFISVLFIFINRVILPI